MRLEKLAFLEINLLNCGMSAQNKELYGIKRQVKNHFDKLNNSVIKHGRIFPFIVAELPNNEKWLIDGYARIALEKRVNKYSYLIEKYDSLIIQAKEKLHVIELYLQNKSSYGSANLTDLRSLLNIINPKEFLEYEKYHDYQILGIIHPNFDFSIMTREEIAEKVNKTKYQII